MKRIVWKISLWSLCLAASPALAQTQVQLGNLAPGALQRPIPKLGRDAVVSVSPTDKQRVSEAEVLDRAEEYCAAKATNPDTSECEQGYAECAFGEGNAHGCDYFELDPNDPTAPKHYLCDKTAAQIAAACEGRTAGPVLRIDPTLSRENLIDRVRDRVVIAPPQDRRDTVIDPRPQDFPPRVIDTDGLSPQQGFAEEDAPAPAGALTGGSCSLQPAAAGTGLASWASLALGLLPLGRLLSRRRAAR